tara:strand:+ start:201 stop:635 length:435 start_codon:yes stop_codon:yes gene_type:complete
MTWFAILKDNNEEKETYYHATDMKNLGGIMAEGLKPMGGFVYASKNPELAINWICMTRFFSEKVLLLPFKIESSKMSFGADHSPLMIRILGFDPEDSENEAYTTTETIPPEDIQFDEAKVYTNPCYQKTNIDRKIDDRDVDQNE